MRVPAVSVATAPRLAKRNVVPLSYPFTLSQYPPSKKNTFLCCCAPIVPATNRRYPFLNHEQPLLTIEGSDWIYDRQFNYVDQWCSIGDSTSLFIYRDEQWKLRSEMILG